MKATNIQNNNDSTSFAAWLRVCDFLKAEFGEGTFNSWLNHLNFIDLKGGEVILSAPSRFIREWILNNYMPKIKELWKRENSAVNTINILIHQNAQTKVINASKNIIAGGVDVTGQNVGVLEVAENNDDLGSPLDRRLTFDNFVVGSSNKLAFAAAKAVAESDGIIPGNNPLFLYGGVGLGKTHLMHAIALQIKEVQPERKVIYISAEKFMYQFVRALRNNDVMAFKENFRGVDVLMIDDVQFICGKESTQEEFFHTVNALLDMNKQIVISGDRSPADLDGMKERVKSRLGWGLVADIKQTDFELRLGILKSKAANMKSSDIPEAVLEFLAGKIKSNIRELEGALNKVIAHSSLMGKKINLQSTQEILVDLLRANERVITIAEIQKKVADYFNVKISDMSSAKRARFIARPRQIAMYICKQLTTRSLSEIGRKFGGKDHTTVMHAVKKVVELAAGDNEFKKDVENLVNLVNQ
jgi:chromosomal replication initiator protein